MKRLTVVALIFMAVSYSAAQENTKWRPGGVAIRGPVHTLRVERASITKKDGEFVEGPRVLIMTYSYNADWTRLEREYYKPDGSLRHKSVFVFDADGRVLEMIHYDGKGILQSRSVAVYDNLKRVSEQIIYGPDGSVRSRRVISRYGDGKSSEALDFNREGSLSSRSIMTSDAKETRSELTTLEADGTVANITSIARNPDGSYESRQEIAGAGPLREVSIPDGKGFMAEQTEYNPDGTIHGKVRYTREYDSYGNYTKATRSVANHDLTTFEPVEVTYHTITYY